jgi:hypothetical protein
VGVGESTKGRRITAPALCVFLCRRGGYWWRSDASAAERVWPWNRGPAADRRASDRGAASPPESEVDWMMVDHLPVSVMPSESAVVKLSVPDIFPL